MKITFINKKIKNTFMCYFQGIDHNLNLILKSSYIWHGLNNGLINFIVQGINKS